MFDTIFDESYESYEYEMALIHYEDEAPTDAKMEEMNSSWLDDPCSPDEEA